MESSNNLLTKYLERKKQISDKASINDMSKFVGVSQQFMTSVFNGDTLLPEKRCDRVAEYLELSQEEYDLLVDTIFKESLAKQVKPLYNKFGKTMPESLNELIPSSSEVPDAEIPVVSKVAANDELGYAHFIPYDTPYRRIKTKGCKAMDVDSDSMSPVALKGQTILYDASKEVRDGDLALVILNDESQLFKRFFRGPKGYITLQSVNSMYPPVIIEEDRVKELFKVVGVWF